MLEVVLDDKNMKNKRQSSAGIIYPILEPFVLRRYLLVASVLILALVFLAPENVSTYGDQYSAAERAYSCAMRVPAINAMASGSTFPLATAFAYLSSLCLGIAGAIIFLFTKIDVDAAMRTLRGRSVLVRVAVVILLVLLWSMQFIDQPALQHFQISYQFFESARTHRALMALWTEGIFLVTFSIGAWISIEFSNLSKGVWRS